MDRTEQFRGRLLDGDCVLIDPLKGFLKTRNKPGNGQAEWTGYFEFPPETREHLEQGHRLHLSLIDGRRGFVNVHVAAHDPLGRNRADFHGQGSPKR